MRSAASARLATLVVAVLGAAGAGAADLSAPPSMPTRLGTCGAEAGGYRLPGTDGCLRITGAVAAEAGWSLAPAAVTLSRGADLTRPTRGGDLSGSSPAASLAAGFRLSADVRLPTDLGPVRAFVSLRGRNGSATDRTAR